MDVWILFYVLVLMSLFSLNIKLNFVFGLVLVFVVVSVIVFVVEMNYLGLILGWDVEFKLWMFNLGIVLIYI